MLHICMHQMTLQQEKCHQKNLFARGNATTYLLHNEYSNYILKPILCMNFKTKHGI